MCSSDLEHGDLDLLPDEHRLPRLALKDQHTCASPPRSNSVRGWCIRYCSGTSKAENRDEVFLLRAKAREGKGLRTEEERLLCIKDYLTAYHMICFYGGEARAEALKQYIGGEYGWQYID